MNRYFFTLVLGLLVSLMNLQAQWTQVGANIDGEAKYDHFGQSISINSDGSVVIIGAPGADTNGSNSGQVKIFRNIGGTWTQVGDDLNGEAAVDRFGASVSINSDGSIIAIGAPSNNGNGYDSGLVRVYKNNSGTWTQIGSDINGEAEYDFSGSSVSLSSDGSIVAIGAPDHYNSLYAYEGAGNVRVFKNVSGTWTQIGEGIDGEAKDENSGSSVSLSADGSIVAIGAPYNDRDSFDNTDADYGVVRVYKNISGTWTQIGDDIFGNDENGLFGTTVSLSSDGSIVAIGAWGSGVSGGAPGKVQIFKNIDGAWRQIGNINGEEANERFGESVSINSAGNIVAIGAPGANSECSTCMGSGQVRIYKNTDDTWTQIDTDITGEAAGDSFGVVSINSDGGTVAIGAYYNDVNGIDSGQVKVYKNNALNVSELKEAGISIYPNPSVGVFTIKNAEGYDVIITDITGKVIYHSTVTANEQVCLQQSGVYIINFKSQTKNFSSKIIVK